jgi:hypothetical protein
MDLTGTSLPTGGNSNFGESSTSYVGPSSLEGPFSVLEETLFLVSLMFSESLPFLVVELPPLIVGSVGRMHLVLSKELLSFVVDDSYLYELPTNSKEYFTVVVGFPVTLQHLNITEELVFYREHFCLGGICHPI